MDKKNTIIGALFFTAAFVLMIWSGMDRQKKLAQWQKDHPEAAAKALTGNVTTPATLPTPPNPLTAGSPAAEAPATAPEATPLEPAKVFPIENDYITVTLSEDGGAIETVALKKFKAHLNQPEPVMFNDGSPLKALGLAFNVSGQSEPVLWPGRFTRVASDQSPTSVAFHQKSPGGVEITRTYSIAATEKEGDPYVITHTTTISNHGEKAVPLHLLVNAGTAPPTPGAGTIAATYLNFSYYDGASYNYISTNTFLGSPGALFGLFAAKPAQPFVWVTRPAPDLQWVSVKNEFFAAVVTPHAPLLGTGYFAKGVKLEVDGKPETGVTGDLEMNLGLLTPGSEKSFALDYYVGPKEYIRLDRLGDKQDLVMQFGWTGWLSKLLLLCLIGIHSAIQHISPEWAWGWSIVTITIFIKLLTYPLTAIQVKSAKRMSQIQKPLAELKERHKDNPQKLQTEMMELFKKNKVNPAAGCLPMFIQLPVFLSFYSMLRTASEMRFASFLWMHDLSAADTVLRISTFPVNVLPVLMTLTTFVQMRMTPSPTTDSVQKQMFQFMPFMMLFFFYSMPSGMILYWICSNLCTIAQQFITNRSKDDPAAALPLDSAKARPGFGRTAKRR